MDEPRARVGDPETSHDAAESVSEFTMTVTRMRILELLRRHGPMTDPHLLLTFRATYGDRTCSESGLRTRRHELCKAGMVRDTGERVQLPSGRRAVVWEAVLEPRALAA